MMIGYCKIAGLYQDLIVTVLIYIYIYIYIYIWYLVNRSALDSTIKN
jgi:cell shape-determining protein MreD